MHLQHVPRAGPLVKIIDVLRHDEKVAVMVGFKFGKGKVSCIGLCIPTVRSSKIIELVDKARIAGKALGRCHFFKVVLRPQPALISECSETALGRDSRAGENDDVQGFLLSMIPTRFIVRPPSTCYTSFVAPGWWSQTSHRLPGLPVYFPARRDTS